MATEYPSEITVDLTALAHNYDVVRSRIGERKLMAVIKANAYGHGAIPVARALRHLGCDWLAVVHVDEAMTLREEGIDGPILVMAGQFPGEESLMMVRGITPAVFDLERAKLLSEAAAKTGSHVGIHLKIDTGMGRMGVWHEDALQFVRTISDLPGLHIKGVMTHLAHADGKGSALKYTDKQLETFRGIVDSIREISRELEEVHCDNSACTLEGRENWSTMVRPGLILYGAYPSARHKEFGELKPVMSWRSRLLFVKRLPKGTPVGYGRTHTLERDSVIAAVPVGYADGYMRSLGNKAQVLVGGERVPVVGRVSMDTTMVDLTDMGDKPKPGDEVVLMGEQGKDVIRAEELADWAGTISYEIFCGIGPRVKRKFVELVTVGDRT